jgi:SAM-dependent methyltransferase
MALKIRTVARKIAAVLGIKPVADQAPEKRENAEYWSDVNVTDHARFASPAASIEYFHWRNAQYHNYIELMPVIGQDGKAVLDYGCGPGNDLVGFAAFSSPSRLVGMDISLRSIAEAKARVALHTDRAEVIPIAEGDARIPLADASIDYLHSSGVVHHAADPAKVLREFRRVVKPSGRCRVMVYNYDSIWLHLVTAYIHMAKQNSYPGLDLRAVFSRLTDGADCPIAHVYRPQEFIDLAAPCGFACRFLGAAISTEEISLLMKHRYEAIQSIDLPREHRDFLWALTLDARGCPMYAGTYAGVDGCYELLPVH